MNVFDLYLHIPTLLIKAQCILMQQGRQSYGDEAFCPSHPPPPYVKEEHHDFTVMM